jgi:hypothetical protein
MQSITTVTELREHLQWAMMLEHATLPPYLCALYSIHPGTNTDAMEVIQSVFVEEMLHLLLAANLLNAVGGTPILDSPDFIPRYPAFLPHSAEAFTVPLARFAPETIDTFMRIERPATATDAPEAERYETIGQFYQAIRAGLQSLCVAIGEPAVFSGNPERQVSPANFRYEASGRVIVVRDLRTALDAIQEVEEQGEGLNHDEVWDGDRDMFHPEREEVAHYFRYDEILRGRHYTRGDTAQSGPTGSQFLVDWTAVYPMRPNPSTSQYADDSAVRAQMHAFNRTYRRLLRGLELALNGEPNRLDAMVDVMFELKTLARELMQLPSGTDGLTAGPSFEYVVDD